MVKEGKFRVDKFNGQNYQLWKMQMEEYLYLPLSEKEKQLTAMKNEEWEFIERKALGTIRLCLASSVAFNISKRKQQRV